MTCLLNPFSLKSHLAKNRKLFLFGAALILVLLSLWSKVVKEVVAQSGEFILRADINNDGAVNLLDALASFSSWNSLYNGNEDINSDQKINGLDFSKLVEEWGRHYNYSYAPSKVLHFNQEQNSGWFYIAQTKPENGKVFWAALVRSLSTMPVDNTAQLSYGITDIVTGDHYSGFLDGGSFSEDSKGVNLFYQKDGKKLVEFRQTRASLGEFEFDVDLPQGTQPSFQMKKILTVSRPLIYESGDGRVPMAPGLDSLYVSLISDQGFWIDFQKFNLNSPLLLDQFSPRGANHRWMSFILDKQVGSLPARTAGVGWEILDGNNQRQTGGYTNIDLLIPGHSQRTVAEKEVNNIQISELEYWNSGYKKYLKKWRLKYLSGGIDLIFETLSNNQENQIAGNYYYEGAIKVIDPSTGEQVGTGMLEQTHDESRD
ncbi:MAG: hypothetical protein M1150_00355 [Patescibacteria group bacterium]|nr:hypothetical protein [Patescibacteria group bacterium]